MSRRSSRRTATKKATSLPEGVKTGLTSFIESNESIIASMLSVDLGNSPPDSSESRAKLFTSLTDCMAMNNLSAEALLARFFDVAVMGAYCEHRLGVSRKGNGATLAARIARAWAKPDFKPLPLESESIEECKNGKKTKSGLQKQEGAAKKRAKDEDSIVADKAEKTKKKKGPTWVPATRHPSITVIAPPGPLGLTIKQYSDDFIVEDVSPSCSIPEAQGEFPRVREGNIITSINGVKIKSEDDPILNESDESREIVIAGKIISRNAADHSKGTLLHMKECGCAMFRIMDYSDVAEKYGEDFFDELSPPNRWKR